MVVTVGSLFNEVKEKDIKLIAGEKGLINIVNWVHMVENIEISTALKGREVTFITGVALQEQDDLFKLIEGIINFGASAIVVNIGPYIKEVNQKCIDYCNQKQIPLFVAPWCVYIPEIIRLFCFEIIEKDKNNLQILASIKNALFFPEQTELYLPQLEMHGLKNDCKYCLAIISINEFEVKEDEKYIERLNQCIEAYFLVNKDKGWCFNINNELVFLFQDINEDKVDEIINKVKKYCEDNDFKNQISIGIGNQTKSIRCISRSYKEAKNIIVLNKKECIEKISKYRDIGIYKLLFAISDRDIMHDYIDETIGKIMEYDTYNNTDLSTVLRCYLSYNGSVQYTANELYIHRNTVNYKIRKIEEIIQMDLSELKVREMIDIAYKLQDIL